MPINKFPRPGFPIVPTVFAPLLDRVLGRAGRLGDLDRTVWQRFNEQTCGKLADTVVLEVNRLWQGKGAKLFRLRVPLTNQEFTLEDLSLSVRTKRRLEQLGIRRFPQDAEGLLVGDLFQIPGFGAKSLVEFLVTLEAQQKVRSGGRQRRRPKRSLDADLNRPRARAASDPRRRPVVPRELRQLIGRQRIIPSRYLGHRLPELPADCSAFDLSLSEPVYRRLKDAGLLEPARLSELIISDLSALPGFGAERVCEFVEACYAVDRDVVERRRRSITESGQGPVAPQELRQLLGEAGNIPMRYWSHRLPKLPADCSVFELPLSGRGYQRLKEAGLTEPPSRLSELTIGALLNLRGLGAHLICELVEAIHSRVAKRSQGSSTESEGWPVAPREIRQLLDKAGQIPFRFWGNRLPQPPAHCVLSDLRLPWKAFRRLKKSGLAEPLSRLGEVTINDLLEVPGLAAQRVCEIVEACHVVQSGVPQKPERPTFDRLVLDILVPAGGPRDVQIVAKRLGLLGQPIHTLNQVALEFRVTRERVRQIAHALEQDLPQLIASPVVQQVLTHLRSAAPCAAETLEQSLQSAQLLERGTTLEAVLGVLRLAKMSLKVRVTDFKKFDRLFVSEDQVARVRQIRSCALKLALHRECGSMDMLLSQLPRGKPVRDLAELTVSSVEQLEWMDETHAWFRHHRCKVHPLSQRILKILSVAPRITLPQLQQALGRDRRLRHCLPTLEALELLCRQTPECEVIGAQIRARRKIDPNKVHRGAELTILRVLQEHGPVLRANRLRKLTRPLGVGPDNFARCLAYQSTIARFGVSVYGLVGTRISPMLIRKMEAE